MIHFDFDWSDLLNKLVLAAAIAILPLQLWMLVFRNRGAGKVEFSGRLAARLTLNMLLWASIVAFILQPYISAPASSKSRLLVGNEVPSDFAEQIKDSLKAEPVTIDDLKRTVVDTLLLVGQSFAQSLFGDLKQLPNAPMIQWIPYYADNQLAGLQWKAIVRKGEMQTVYGSLKSSQQQAVKIQFGNQTLDSAVLHAGFNDFRLKFPTFTQGKSSVELVLGNRTMDTLRFFARPAEPITVRFLLDNPDFETRTLATWLGKNGNAVHYDVKLSEGLQSNQNINAAKDPDLIITDPGNASDILVKKALNGGKSVLFMNLNNPAAEISAINTSLATKFQVRKISNEPNVRISSELNASPYHFIKSVSHLELPRYPVAVEKTRGKVGVSLLAETFPMQLTGDSIAYEQVWNAILALVRPSVNQIELQAPVYSGLKTQVFANNLADFMQELRLGNDTIFMQKSVLNPKSAFSEFLPTEAGWVALQDSVPADVFVENSGAGFKKAQMADFVKSYSAFHASFGSGNTEDAGNYVNRKIPDWFWFVWLLLCFTALWIAAKF